MFFHKYNQFILFCNLRIDSPESSMRIALWTILSRTASAMVFSPMMSCQAHTGTCEVMIVARRPCLSSMMSMRFERAGASKGCIPEVVEYEQVCALDPLEFGQYGSFGFCGLELSHKTCGACIKHSHAFLTCPYPRAVAMKLLPVPALPVMSSRVARSRRSCRTAA